MNLNFCNSSMIKQCIASLTSLLLHLSLGVCQGFSAVLIPQLLNEDFGKQITNNQISWIASVCVIMMPVGSMFVGVLMDIYGRKKVVQFSFVPLVLGWAVISSADTVLTLCLGRMITGMAVGADPAVIIYIAETNIPKYRAVMLSLTGPTVLIGTLLAYLTGYFLYWRHAALVLSGFSLGCFVIFFFIPESPVWLISKNKIKEATESLEWLRNKNDQVQVELDELLKSKTTQTNNVENVPYLKKIIVSKAWKPFLILTFYFALQMFAGNNIILYYAVNFYEAFGMTNIDGFISSIIYVSISLCCAFICTAIVEKYNRKTLTMVSSFGICITCLAAAMYSYFYEDVENKPISWFPLVCMCIYMLFGLMGLFSLPWIMAGELFPSQVRGFMTSLLWVTVYFYIFVTVKMYPLIIPFTKIYGLLLIFSITGLISLFFAKFILPETRGKTLTEIENFW